MIISLICNILTTDSGGRLRSIHDLLRSIHLLPVSCPVNWLNVRVAQMGRDKARCAGNGLPFPSIATPYRCIWAAPFGRTGTSFQRCCVLNGQCSVPRALRSATRTGALMCNELTGQDTRCALQPARPSITPLTGIHGTNLPDPKLRAGRSQVGGFIGFGG